MPTQLSLFDINVLAPKRKLREETRQETEEAIRWTWARDRLYEWLQADFGSPLHLKIVGGHFHDDAYLVAWCIGDEAIDDFVRFRVALGYEWCDVHVKGFYDSDRTIPSNIYHFRLQDMRLLPKRHIPDEAEFKQSIIETTAKHARQKGKEPDLEALQFLAEERWKQFKQFLYENPKYEIYQVR